MYNSASSGTLILYRITKLYQIKKISTQIIVCDHLYVEIIGREEESKTYHKMEGDF